MVEATTLKKKKNKGKKIKFPIVEVYWDDICTAGGWRSTRRNRPVKCFSVGYLTYQDAKTVTVSGSFNECVDYSDLTSIPRGCITKIKRLGTAQVSITIGTSDKDVPAAIDCPNE